MGRALLERLASVQIRHPFQVLGVAIVTLALAGWGASKLTLKTALGELLPENKESVLVAEKVNARLPAISTLGVVIEGSDNEALKHYVNALAPKIREIGPPLVGVVDEGVQDSKKFFEDRAFLYADLELVQEVHDEIIERYEYEVAKAAGTLLDEENPPPPLTEESIKKRLRERAKEKNSDVAKAEKQYPDGYYLSEKDHFAVIIVRTPIRAGDVEQSKELQRRIREAADSLDESQLDSTIRVGFGGNLISSAETRKQIEGDLQHVGVWGVSLILGIVFLYYLRLRMLVTMTLTVGIGAVWTFGLAYPLVGHLNSSTGFLFSIVVGNGINFGIIYMARYLEARRNAEADESIRIAHRETWLSTLTASGAATAAYGSLAVTDFRGFKHFGIIGGTGMLLCWLATYLFMPAILILFERVRPIQQPTGFVARVQGAFGRPFAFVASRFPAAVAVAGLAITAGSSYLAYRYVTEDPMEYDMKRIGNDPVEHVGEWKRFGRMIDQVAGRQGMDGIALATERIEQVLPLKAELEKVRAEAPDDRKPFKSVVTVYSLLPKKQDEKLELVKDAYETLKNAHDKGFMAEEEWKKIERLLPEERQKKIGIADLPDQVARHFTEKDGTRGRLVYITPQPGRSVWNGHYLIDWASAIRTTKLPDGSVVKGSGRSVIFADVIINVTEDAPRAIVASLLATLLIILIAFRGRAAGLWVIGSVVVGLVWTVAILQVYGSDWPWSELGRFRMEPLKLNFLNFVAIPITIGVGADYAVNVMQRYRLAGGQMKRVVVETGGAVILCSLTTMLGYSALTLSVNRAVQSFGGAAAAGEVCCVLTGVLVLPAILLWRAQRQASE
jgi:predicted RND superfamily exporter protein